jgi:tellurite resistance protein TerA
MVDLRKLTADAPKISLEKSSTLTGRMRINLNWSQPARKKGFWASLSAPVEIDLDLGCLVEMTDGSIGVVQALGNAFGDYDSAPFIELDGDDRSGQSNDGENLFVNLDHIQEIKRFLVFAFIYEGATVWSTANGVVSVYPPSGAPVVVNLESHDTKKMCAIALVTVDNGQVSVERQVKYFDGHEEMDRAYKWGLNWTVGYKD